MDIDSVFPAGVAWHNAMAASTRRSLKNACFISIRSANLVVAEYGLGRPNKVFRGDAAIVAREIIRGRIPIRNGRRNSAPVTIPDCFT